MTEIREKLKQIVPEEHILFDELMKNHTTFRVGGPADIYLRPDIGELSEVITLLRKENYPYQVIGNGSNLLVTDKGIRGAVIEIGTRAASLIHLKEGNTHLLVAEAGVRLSALAQKAAEYSLTGLEFAAGIPGTVGGAVAMNAGAYGGEMKDVLVEATVLTEAGEKLTLSAKELELSYRHSVVMEQNYIVLSASFELTSADEASIREKMADFAAKRREKQPLEYPSAGSTFKRPEGYFAGKLIEDANLRGYSVGDAQVSEKHCGFVVNRGEACATDILQLIEDVRKKVLENSGIVLEPEVRIIGER